MPRCIARQAFIGCLLASAAIEAGASLPDWALEIGTLTYADYELHSLVLSKSERPGTGTSPQTLAIDVEADRVSLGGTTPDLGPVALPAEISIRSGGLIIRIPKHDLDSLRFLKPLIPQLEWITSGHYHAVFELGGIGAGENGGAFSLSIDEAGFDSPDGLFAGLGLGVELSVSLTSGSASHIPIDGAIRHGELLLFDFYRDFSSGSLEFAGRLDPASPGLSIPQLVVTDDAGLRLVSSLQIPAESAAPDIHVRELNLVFPESYSRYLESVASTAGMGGLETSGTLSWQGDWSPGTLGEGTLTITSVSVSDQTEGRFDLQELNAEIRSGTNSRMQWGGFSFGKVDLGPGEAVIELSPDLIKLIEPISVPLFGGSFNLEALTVRDPAGPDADFVVHANVADVDLAQVTRALDWPEFEGTLSATIPGANWSQGVLSVAGMLDFDVFGGRVVVSNLAIERPFGVLPSLAAHMSLADLDLEAVTQTFSFGRIAGRLSGYVNDLRMLDWKPVAFDGWIGTPADDERHDISRQAVNHLTTLGGGSATAALTSPILRLFNNFSYRRLGLGCTLSNNVCQIRGIEDQGDGILIMQGAGIPKISILAYNRSVDWPQLVAELATIASSQGPQIGD